MKIMLHVFCFTLLAALLAGCASTHAREIALDQSARTAALEPQDVRRTVDAMVDSLIADKEFIQKFGGEKVTIAIAELSNKTTMHLETSSIITSVRTKLLRAHQFRFMDLDKARLCLYGELNEMRQQIDGVTDRYFKCTLNLKDSQTGEYVWSDEKEIRKEQKTSVFGF